MSTEAMKLALEALEESLGYVEEEAENAQRLYGQYPTRQARIQGLKDDVRKHMKAITALREVLAEPQPEPVAWIWKYANGEEEVVFVPPRHVDATHVDAPSTITPLYTSPPAQRKPLTDAQIETVWRSVQANDFHDCVKPFARAIEAAHNIKGDA